MGPQGLGNQRQSLWGIRLDHGEGTVELIFNLDLKWLIQEILSIKKGGGLPS